MNGDSEQATREYARLASAYRVLSNPPERVRYDARYERWRSSGGASCAAHPSARRVPEVSAQARMGRIVDSLLAADQRETLALQRAVYPIVALFVSFIAPSSRLSVESTPKW